MRNFELTHWFDVELSYPLIVFAEHFLTPVFHPVSRSLTECFSFLFLFADKLEKPDKPDSERPTPFRQGSNSSSSISSPPGGGQQQVCVVLQPPLPSLSNRSSSPTSLGSLADNVRPSTVPIILAPSPAHSSRPRSSPKGSRSSTPTDPGPKQLEMSEEGPGDEATDGEQTKPGPAVNPVSSPRAKASIHDI